MKQKALWVDVLGESPPLANTNGIKELLHHAKIANITDIYLQIVRSGKCWFNLENECFYTKQEKSRDPLQEALEIFADANIKIHPWINVFNLGMECKEVEKEILQKDQRGQSIDHYIHATQASKRDVFFQLDSQGFWIDPCNSYFRHVFIEMLTNLKESYPSLAGVHLDFFRYPYCLPISPLPSFRSGVDFGYTEEAQKLFYVKHHIQLNPDKVITEEVALKWNQFRRDVISSYLKEVQALFNNQEVSVAVIPWSDRAYLNAFQDWRGWLEQDLLDKVCLMSYTSDLIHFSHLVKQSLSFRTSYSEVIAGIGTYKLGSVEELNLFVEKANQQGVDGIALFSYRNIIERWKPLLFE